MIARHRLAARSALAAALVAMLTACAPLPAGTPSAEPSAPAPSANAPAPSASASAPASATPVTGAVPADCADLVDGAVADQLADTPLNDPSFGGAGQVEGGGLLCVWAAPSADTTRLTVLVTPSDAEQSGYAKSEILAIAGATCADDAGGGTRCEASWQNDDYPVTDGRLLYARGDVRVDVQYSNLLPDGFLDGVISAVWR